MEMAKTKPGQNSSHTNYPTEQMPIERAKQGFKTHC